MPIVTLNRTSNSGRLSSPSKRNRRALVRGSSGHGTAPTHVLRHRRRRAAIRARRRALAHDAAAAEVPQVLLHRDYQPEQIAASSRFTVHDAGTALSLVANGIGIAMMPRHTANSRSDVAVVPLEPPGGMLFAAAWSRFAPERIVRERFLDALANWPPREPRQQLRA